MLFMTQVIRGEKLICCFDFILLNVNHRGEKEVVIKVFNSKHLELSMRMSVRSAA